MGNKGNKVASLGQLCRYLATVAEEKGVEIYSGFSVNELLFENNRLSGVKTNDTGLNHEGKPMENFQEGTTVKADLIVFAEGSRGTMTGQLKDRFQLMKDSNATNVFPGM